MTMKEFSRSIPFRGMKSRMRKYLAAGIAFGLFYLTVAASHAQLGPKDGAGLAPLNLERVKIGDAAPDFTLENMDGRRITLSEVFGKKNVLLVFYRGQW